jgi:hypothetical protein
MARYTIFLFVVVASAATAIAAIAPDAPRAMPSKNVTVIEKNQAFPLVGPLIVEDCATEDCATDHG